MLRLKACGLTFMLAGCVAQSAMLLAADDNQSVQIEDKVQIPGGSLKAGTYTFSVEDRLADRAIVRITSSDGGKHYLLLSVPSDKISTDSSNNLLFFKSRENKEALKAWKCPSCEAPLEFVYPKLEAVKITDESTEPVLAVDPTYDKLPSNLSADDMKVVTLWLLSPERINADNTGVGVKAAKYADAKKASNQQVANASPVAPQPAPTVPAPAAAPAPAASVAEQAPSPAIASNSATGTLTAAAEMPSQQRHKLPKTASNNGLFALCGLTCLGSALVLRRKRNAVSTQ